MLVGKVLGNSSSTMFHKYGKYGQSKQGIPQDIVNEVFRVLL